MLGDTKRLVLQLMNMQSRSACTGSAVQEAYGASQNSGYLFGVPPVMRAIVYWGLYWGRPILGNYHITQEYATLSLCVYTCSLLQHDLGCLKPDYVSCVQLYLKIKNGEPTTKTAEKLGLQVDVSESCCSYGRDCLKISASETCPIAWQILRALAALANEPNTKLYEPYALGGPSPP